MSVPGKVSRLVHTVVHLRASQVINRVARRWPRAPRAVGGVSMRGHSRGWVVPVARSPRLAADFAYTVVNETHSLAEPTGWNPPSATRLWTYHVHDFGDLMAPEAAGRTQQFRRLMSRWIAENPAGHGAGWEPYPMSRRIVNWLKWGLAGHPLDAEVLASLALQASHLERSLEFHLLGNHLLANAKALVFAGAILQCDASARWLEKGRRLLVRELREQILPDGGHHELSPMYHAIVLEDILDLVNLHSATGLQDTAGLREVATRMLTWLAQLCHPDRSIALFNDSTLDGGPAPGALEDYARRLGVPVAAAVGPGLTWLANSGYARLALGPAVALIDAGHVGPDHQPGHAHADTLSFELSLFGGRVVVDTGTSTYARGPERDRQRSTAAHNTVSVDGRNSSDTWAAFRVGKRARPRDIVRQVAPDSLTFGASHDGYADGRQGVVHRRDWFLREGSLRIRDHLAGRGEHEFELALHLHPGVLARALGPTSFALQLGHAGPPVRIETDRSAQSVLEASNYHPCFGVSRAAVRIASRARARVPVSFETLVAWGNGGPSETSDTGR